MKQMTNRAVLAAMTVFVIAGVAYAVPEVTNVTMAQRERSRIVDITYDLTGEEAAIITLGIETNGVALPDSAVKLLTGDVSMVIQPGSDRHIVWNAGVDWPENLTQVAKAKVTAWSVDAPPLYCAVDVVSGWVTNVYPVYYYVSAEAVPEGVTSYLYKTTRILMRKIPPTGAGGFKMGAQPNEIGRNTANEVCHDVVLTKAFYAGVYQVTQWQWEQVMGDKLSWPSRYKHQDYNLTRPVETVSYYNVRENWSEEDANGSPLTTNWPQTNAVGEVSFMGRLQAKTGLAGFDLPTDAQWEYACRAGEIGALNDGTVNITNNNSDARLDVLGRYIWNGGKINNGADLPLNGCSTAFATAAVGSYPPNTWGLYDMHGNVHEWCLDWYEADLGTAKAADPRGIDTGSNRIRRGGCFIETAAKCRSAARSSSYPSHKGYDIGFRLFRNLP
ncbi:MAG: formylglycine-generating enzyme family protein [Kiritimatiellia bacterium]